MLSAYRRRPRLGDQEADVEVEEAEVEEASLTQVKPIEGQEPDCAAQERTEPSAGFLA